MSGNEPSRNETLGTFVNHEKRDRRLYMAMYNLPGQLERARRRVRQLEAQANRWGMSDLVQP